MEIVLLLIGFIVLLGLLQAYAAQKVREQGECVQTKLKYCCRCGNRLRLEPVTQATDAVVDTD
jgi:hypothetical protein